MRPGTPRGVSNALGVLTLLGVVLVVAVTTGLMSVVFYTPPPVVEEPDATMTFEYDRDLTDGDSVVVEHAGGDTLYSDRVSIELSGANDESVNGEVSWATVTESEEVTEGDQLVLNQTTLSGSADRLDLSAASIRVVAEGESDTYTVGRWSGPDA